MTREHARNNLDIFALAPQNRLPHPKNHNKILIELGIFTQYSE